MRISTLFSFLFLSTILLVWACDKEDLPDDPKYDLANMPYEKLSDYNFFDGNIADLKPIEGVLPYDLNTPLFSNYAHKARFVWMPDGTTANYSEDDAFDFPVGAILVKTFYYPVDFRDENLGRNLIETRILIKKEVGWEGYPYVWNPTQSDADLKITGKLTNVEWIHTDGQSRSEFYAVPNQNECVGCHNIDNDLLPLGPKARNLNKLYPYASGDMNQLSKWVEMGYLTGSPSNPVDAPKVPLWNDLNADIEERARAYLDINCGACHNRQAPASNSGLSLHYNEDSDVALGICKPPVAAGGGSGGRDYDIVPGNADASIMVYRMESNDLDIAMPELSRSVIHEEGVELIKEWINGLSGDCL